MQELTRHAVRTHIFRLLFASCFFPEDEQATLFTRYLAAPPAGSTRREDEPDFYPPVPEAAETEIKDKLQHIREREAELDAVINRAARGWRTGRMNLTDLCILRLAVYEIRYEDISNAIAINEAVSLAKIYSGKDAPAFINGVLAAVVRETP